MCMMMNGACLCGEGWLTVRIRVVFPIVRDIEREERFNE